MSKPMLALLASLMVAGCATPVAEQSQTSPAVQTDNPYAITGERAGAGLRRTERENIGKALADRPELAGHDADEFADSLTLELWRKMSKAQREGVLKLLKQRGSDWAGEVLTHGGYDDLDESTDEEFLMRILLETDRIRQREKLEAEIEETRRRLRREGILRRSLPGGYSGDPMPFGDSMWGPWHTDRDPNEP